LVASDATSEPALGSENPWHQISSAETIFGRKRAFCSSVPAAMIVGPIRYKPSELISGARPFLLQDRHLYQLRGAPAVFLRPRDRGPSALADFALPITQVLEVRAFLFFGRAARPGRRRVGLQPCAQFVAELPLFWCEI
jgi:hypothetical protein